MGVSKILGRFSQNFHKVFRPISRTLYFEAAEANSTVKFHSYNAAATFVTSTNGGLSWESYTDNTTVTLQNVGDRIYFSAGDEGNDRVGGSNFSYTNPMFSFTGKIRSGGNIICLLSPNVKENLEIREDCALAHLFDNNYYKSESLISAPYIKCGNVNGAGAFYDLFRDCKSITEVDFSGVTNITGAMAIFYNSVLRCSSLKKITVGFSSWNDNGNGTLTWMSGVAASGVFICPEGLQEIHDDSHIPVGWRVIRIPSTPVVPMTVISDYQNAEVYRDVTDHDIIIKFTESGSVTFANNVTARVLAVGGGGAGGTVRSSGYSSHAGGGGGGGGEVLDRSGVDFSKDVSYQVFVGAGGVSQGSSTSASAGGNGGDSYITDGVNANFIRVYGGGGGGGEGLGSAGGSGGGASHNASSGSTAGSASNKFNVDGNGNAGGESVNRYGGGGGGASTSGIAANEKGGDGGDGVDCDITDETVTYGGGGGGGATKSGKSGGAGGQGGGGRGGVYSGSGASDPPHAGKNGLGGGGGGGGRQKVGAAGGSGIVIIRVTAYQE